ncbi:MAG: dTDP-4-dehydrorhamnose reductase [Dehalococcoidia bacterium]|jgi:dTDP-4-dehydrorhamnose reductase
MKIMLIGANGQLGTELCVALKDQDLVPLTQEQIEISEMDSIIQVCRTHKPQMIINTASYIRVDDCEDNVDLAYRINALGARNLAVAAQEYGAVLAHLSSDYVFGADEKRQSPYNEFDIPAPINVYGFSKLAGEQYIQNLCRAYFIIRTSALYGAALCMGKGSNFVDTIIKLSKEKSELRIVKDQVLSTTYAKDLAVKISQLIRTKYYGITHITNSGSCSWFEFADEILKLTGSQVRIVPATSEQFPTRARRPFYSVLSNYHLKLIGMEDMRDWRSALREYLKEKNILH